MTRFVAFVASGLLAGCSIVGLRAGLEEESQARINERLLFLRMSRTDVALVDDAIDPGGESGKRSSPLENNGQLTVILSDPGWQGCRSLELTAGFTDTGRHRIDARLSGLLCPPQPVSALGHWHLAHIQILAPEPPPPPPLPPARHNSGAGFIGTSKPETTKPAPAKP